MKKWILLLLSAALLSAATPDAKTEKEIMAAMDAYKQAMIKRDAAALSKVLSDDLVYTHSSNQHQNKAEVLAAINGPSAAIAIEFKDLKVRVYGDAAVVVGDVDFHSGTPANETVSKLNVLHVLAKTPQGWQIVARQATRYTDTAPAKK